MDAIYIKCEALKKAIKLKDDVLRNLEWSCYDEILGSVCPSCGSSRVDGHALDCDLMRALNEYCI